MQFRDSLNFVSVLHITTYILIIDCSLRQEDRYPGIRKHIVVNYQYKLLIRHKLRPLIYVYLFIILTPNFLSVKFGVAIFCHAHSFTERYI